jgi:hypothetical protein
VLCTIDSRSISPIAKVAGLHTSIGSTSPRIKPPWAPISGSRLSLLRKSCPLWLSLILLVTLKSGLVATSGGITNFQSSSQPSLELEPPLCLELVYNGSGTHGSALPAGSSPQLKWLTSLAYSHPNSGHGMPSPNKWLVMVAAYSIPIATTLSLLTSLDYTIHLMLFCHRRSFKDATFPVRLFSPIEFWWHGLRIFFKFVRNQVP